MPRSPEPSAKIRALKVALGLLAATFVALAGYDIFRRWDDSRVTVDPRWLGPALLTAFLATTTQAFAWRRLVAHWTGRPLPLASAFGLFFAGQLARYTPGKVGLPAVRMAGAARLGVPAKVMATTLLVETLVWGVLGATVSSGLLSAFPERLFSLPKSLVSIAWIGVVSGVLALGALALVPRGRLPLTLREKLGLSGSGPLVPTTTLVLVLGHWLLWIAHGSCVGAALGAESFEAALLVGGSLVLAIVVGFFSVLAPAGAGVREAIMGAGAAPILGAGGAIVAALCARGASLLAEVVLWALFRRASVHSGEIGSRSASPPDP